MPGRIRKARPSTGREMRELLNAAIKAVRDAGAQSTFIPKVMIHIAQPENIEPWFAAAMAAGVTDFDLIGISYYPKWSKDPISELGATINRLRIDIRSRSWSPKRLIPGP